jgi:hypothetical protein
MGLKWEDVDYLNKQINLRFPNLRLQHPKNTKKQDQGRGLREEI